MTPRVAVTGASGQLGTAFAKLLPEATLLTRADLNLADVASIVPTLDELAPATLINCAAYTAVDAAETDEQTAFTVNAAAVEAMAAWCASHSARFVTYSTDYVFDGTAERPYIESDPTAPINAYGRTKAAGERLALAANPQSLIVRTSWLISGTHPNFISTVLERAGKGTVQVVDDQWGCPTIADDLAVATLRTLEADATGILHLTNQGVTTWYGVARRAVELAGLDPDLVQRTTSDAFPRPAPRPHWSVLGSERLAELDIEPLTLWEQSLPYIVQAIIDWP
ncbi:MAG: dTDP-4-dehydrorhamnose reductase [Gammaproteobacteria bacterium]|nr:dTDP-4-dehydrorhamnose reductase [Gammaproteobacteria bacterium]